MKKTLQYCGIIFLLVFVISRTGIYVSQNLDHLSNSFKIVTFVIVLLIAGAVFVLVDRLFKSISYTIEGKGKYRNE